MNMKIQKAIVENGEIKIISTKEINQDNLTSECWLIQFNGLKACDTCEYLNTSECGGINIRKKLLKEV